MLSEDEKKAIDYYKNNEYSFGFEADFDIENFKKAIGIEETDEDTFERHQIRFKTLLNLIEKQQAEIENDNNIISDLQNEVTLKQCDLEEKDKIIYKMGKAIYRMDTVSEYGFNTEEIIEYFTNKVEEDK